MYFRALFILLLSLSSLWAEGEESKIYFKVGWGISNLSSLQSSNGTSTKIAPMQNIEIGYDINIVRLATFVKFGQDTALDDYVLKIGYRLGVIPKNVLEMKFEPITIIPVLTLNSSYFTLDTNSTLSGNSIGGSLVFDVHFAQYKFLSTFLEYEYERSAIYDSSSSSTDFYKVDAHLFILGFSVLF